MNLKIDNNENKINIKLLKNFINSNDSNEPNILSLKNFIFDNQYGGKKGKKGGIFAKMKGMA